VGLSHRMNGYHPTLLAALASFPVAGEGLRNKNGWEAPAVSHLDAGNQAVRFTARSKRSAFITLLHAATKSRANFSFASAQA